jgi:hypothetical protein
MAGPGDAFGGIAATLARLLSKPGIQSIGSNLQRQLPQVSGPFGVSPSSGTYHGNSSGPSGAFSAGSGIGSILAGLGSKYGGIGAQLGSLTGSVNTQTDPMQLLYQQLIDQLQQPVDMPTGVNKEDLMKQVQDALNPIYDQQAKAAENRTGRYTKDVKDMYGALSQDYKDLAPQQIAQADEAQKQIEQMYGQLRSNIEGSYSRVSNEQADLFQKLGIQSALPDVLQQQAAPEQQALTAASQDQASQQQRYMDIGQMDSTYYREGAPNAVMKGNEVSTDLISQLQNYLDQTDAQRTSAIQTSYMDQLGQANTQLGQQQQVAQTEAARRQEMLWNILSSQLSGNKQQTALTPDTFMGQLPPQVQQSVASAFTQLQRSPEAVYGKVQDPRNPVPGTYVDTSPQWYLAQADQMLQSGAIDQSTYQALQMYMQLYFGLGK